MSQQTRQLYNNAELALAAYATLDQGSTSTEAQIEGLMDAGMSETQARQFAQHYTNVVAQVATSPTGFAATVFQDAAGNLTLAFRGTEPLANDFGTDALIAFSGAGYDQIIEMYNWWMRVASTDVIVPQFRITKYDADAANPPATGLLYVDGAGKLAYLESAPAVLATGELAAYLSNDSDQRVDVTGHSLGAHLSLAFNAIFSSCVSNVFGYNTPGFTNTAINQEFFQTLGAAAQTNAALPTQANSGNVTNVLADEASVGQQPFSAIAGLFSPPGTTLGIAIENQWLSDEPNPDFGSRNHSQKVLTDSLAVFDLLSGLAPALTPSDYKTILNQAALGTAAGYERIVDALQLLLGVDQTPLPIGNGERNVLYDAIYGLRSNPTYLALSGSLAIRPTTS